MIDSELRAIKATESIICNAGRREQRLCNWNQPSSGARLRLSDAGAEPQMTTGDLADAAASPGGQPFPNGPPAPPAADRGEAFPRWPAWYGPAALVAGLLAATFVIAVLSAMLRSA